MSQLHDTAVEDQLYQYFVTLFVEAEPFAAIVIAHGTHGHSRNFSWVLKFEAKD